MSIRLEKPWRPRAEAPQLSGQLGVFQLADNEDQVVFIGVADARSLFGLRSAVADAFSRLTDAVQFRVESTSAYHTRYRELLMMHVADHGALPTANPKIALGRLHP